jgi:hypothetical protein
VKTERTFHTRFYCSNIKLPTVINLLEFISAKRLYYIYSAAKKRDSFDIEITQKRILHLPCVS